MLSGILESRLFDQATVHNDKPAIFKWRARDMRREIPMRRAATENETFEVGGQARPRARSVLARKARLRRLAMDSLENRTLLATLPAATYATNLAAIVNAGPNDNNSSPQIAIDRYDASKLVAVWVNTDPTDRP